MPNWGRRRSNQAEGADNSGKYICGKCQEDAGKLKPDERNVGVWRGEQTVYHCMGSLYVFGAKSKGEPHHYNTTFGGCWKCGRAIGCRLCVGIEQEVLCENIREHGGLGSVWATKRALLEHGPLIRQPNGPRQTLADYPSDWAQEYEPLEVSDTAVEHLNRLLKSIGTEKPRGMQTNS